MVAHPSRFSWRNRIWTARARHGDDGAIRRFNMAPLRANAERRGDSFKVLRALQGVTSDV